MLSLLNLIMPRVPISYILVRVNMWSRVGGAVFDIVNYHSINMYSIWLSSLFACLYISDSMVTRMDYIEREERESPSERLAETEIHIYTYRRVLK